METIQTFVLPSQFLVWVAKKIFAHRELDLVLTEYYNKRLESQPENRETHTKASVLTKSNKLTGLGLSTD